MKFSLRFPTPYTVLFIVIILCAVATWLLPAGQYDRLSYNEDNNTFVIKSVAGDTTLEASAATLEELHIPISIDKFKNGSIKRTISVPDTYHSIESKPQGFKEILFAPIKGMYDSIDIILFVLIIGGFIGVFNDAGAFDEGIGYLANKLKGREGLLIIIVTTLIAIGGTTFGMAEETFAFYPILIPVFIAAGYDMLVPVAVIFVGSCIGTMGALINPFGTIIASDAAGVSWTVGLYSRLAMLLAGTTLSIIYILRYANKVKKNPVKSLVKNNLREEEKRAIEEVTSLKASTKLLLVLFALTFLIMIYGVAALGWWFEEMTALFLVAAIVVGLIQRVGEQEFVKVFMAGAKDLLGVTFIIGIARGVTFILNEGQISDTILFYAIGAVDNMPVALFMPALMVVFMLMTLFISSSSGLAVVSMPIISALSPVMGVPPEEIVNAYLFGFGIMTFITPTGLALPSLAMVNVNYNTWLRFITPLLLMLSLLATLILWAGVYI